VPLSRVPCLLTAILAFGTQLDRVAKEHPEWRPQMVQGRLKRTKEELAALPASDE
jgi:hypothetical protein